MIAFATLFSSSRGNSVFVTDNSNSILVDAGMPMYRIKEQLEALGYDAGSPDAIFITHEHSDHVKSAGSLSRKYNIPVYTTKQTALAAENCLGRMDQRLKSYDYGMTIGDFRFDFFKIYHDAVQPVGLVVENKGVRLGICTDTGIFTPGMAKILKNCDAYVFESNHDLDMLWKGSYDYALKQRIAGKCGHLSNDAAAEALASVIGPATKEIVLAHLSEENNTPELAYNTSCEMLRRQGREDIHLQVAPADRAIDLITLD